MRKEGREPALPPPNRKASNDKFVAKTAILSSFSWFVFTLHETVKTLSFFCSSPFFRKKFSSSGRKTCSCCFFLFFFGLHYVSCGVVSYPNPKLVSNKISPPPQSRLLSRTMKTFFLVFTYVICVLGRPQSKILATPMINDESSISK